MLYRNREFRSRPALTILEIIIALAIVTIIFAAVLPQLRIIRNGWDSRQAGTEVLQNGRVLIDHISRNLSNAVKITDVSESTETNGFIEFQDNDSNNWRYDINSTTSYVEFGLVGTLSDLAGPVNDLQFTCYDACDLDTALDITTADINDIRYVEVETTLINSLSASQNKTFTTTAYLRINDESSSGSCWINEDIGDVGAAGSATQADSNWVIEGSGVDIWNYTDEFHFVYQPLSGDGQITARVVSIENTNSWAKAGVMIRETLDGDSTHAMMVVTPGNGTAFQRRTSTGSSSDHTAGSSVTAPYWVKLVRSGDTLTGYESPDGSTWTQVDSVSINMATDVYIGLAVTSHSDGDLCTAEIDNISFGEVTYETFTEAKVDSDNTSITIPTPAGGGAVTLLGSWTSGLTHTAETGSNRALIFIAHVEEAGAVSLDSVTYGGQSMTKVTEEIVGTTYSAYVVAYILDEDGIAAATSDTFSTSWSTTPDNVSYTSVFLSNVNQTNLVGDSDENGTASGTPNPITTSALSTSDGDMVIVAATCGNTGDYTVNNGFTEGLEQDMTSSTGVSGYKAADGSNETPSTTHSGPNRQVIIGFVVRVMGEITGIEGDLLIAAVATDGDTSTTLSPPAGEGWVGIVYDYSNQVTLGAWYKLADASESSSHQFTWSSSNPQQAYGWIMHFTGHDPTNPINTYSVYGETSSTPTSPEVTTTVNNCLILRLGAFDNDDVTTTPEPGDPGLSGHTAITMDESSSGMSPPAAWWKLDETSGLNAEDSSGNGNDGTLRNMTGNEWITDGAIDGALNFDGSNDYVAIQNLYYNGSDYAEVTVTAWIRTTNGGNQIIASYDRNEYWRLEVNGNGGGTGRIGWDVRTSNGQVDHGSTTRVDDGYWHHVAGVFDNGTLTIYIDGNPETPDSGGSTFGRGNVRYGFLGVGSEATSFDGNKGPNNYFDGDMDDVRIYNYALETDEIVALAGGGGNGETVSGGAGYLKQPASGDSGTADFALTASNASQMITVAIAPTDNSSGDCGGTIYP